MNVELKPLEEQVIVITGATSGIGLTTARMAADRGAKLVLAARNEAALAALVEEIELEGGDAIAVPADVSDREDVEEIANEARAEYGGFDTWVNDAGAFIYGRLDETPIEDMREQFDVNVWGLLYGSLEAAEEMRHRGGAIVNVGSAVSDLAIPLQGSYSASKHAVKGFTDALRMELEDEGAPVSVTLIKPGSVGTPYPQHAKNFMDVAPELPAPIYAPETVARAILHAAEHPERDVVVGGGGKLISLLGRFAPRLGDRIMERSMFDQQRGDRPAAASDEGVLDESVGDLEERGESGGHVSETSLYTRAMRNPRLVGAILAGIVGIAGFLLMLARRSDSDRDRRSSDRRTTDQRTRERPDRSTESDPSEQSARRTISPQLD